MSLPAHCFGRHAIHALLSGLSLQNIEPKRQALLLRRWLLTHRYVGPPCPVVKYSTRKLAGMHPLVSFPSVARRNNPALTQRQFLFSLDILAKCTLPADEYLIQHRSARERKTFRKFVNSFHALNSNESTSLDDEREKIATFNYFREKVMAVRIWRDHRFELFNALKAEVQALTDRIAAKCHDRTRAIMLEDDGKLLCNLRWNPSAATIATDQGELEVNREGEEASITRQDDVRVQAIVVHPDCSKEEVVSDCLRISAVMRS